MQVKYRQTEDLGLNMAERDEVWWIWNTAVCVYELVAFPRNITWAFMQRPESFISFESKTGIFTSSFQISFKNFFFPFWVDKFFLPLIWCVFWNVSVFNVVCLDFYSIICPIFDQQIGHTLNVLYQQVGFGLNFFQYNFWDFCDYSGI